MSVQLELRITVSNTGEIRVYGPIQNKILCYGLLEIAKDIIKTYKPEEQSDIIVPQVAIVPKQS